MTKIGEGPLPYKPTQESYHKQLNDNILHFENALIGYQECKDHEEIAHLQTIMNQQMEMIRTSINEIKRSGIHKQGGVISKDYQAYCQNPSNENYSALQQDLSTLKEYNYLPD